MRSGVQQAIGRRRGVVLGLAVVALLAIVAAAVGAHVASAPLPGSLTSGAAGQAGDAVVAGIGVLLVIAVALAGIILHALLPTRRGRKAPDDGEWVSPPPPPLSLLERVLSIVLPLILIGTLVTALVLASRHAHGQLLQGVLQGSPLLMPPRASSRAALASGGAHWLDVGLAAGTLLVAVAGVVLLVGAHRRRREAAGRAPRRRQPRPAAAGAAVSMALDDLRGEPDPRRAIIAAYARMERAFALSGFPRSASETSGEYLSRVLASASAPPAALRELTLLFQEAKFSHHHLTGDQRESALRALVRIREAITA